MPTYAFQCATCGLAFDRILTHIEHSQTMWQACPRCQKAAMAVPSAPAIHFKGSGWTPKFYPET